jgi:hypothetical protein
MKNTESLNMEGHIRIFKMWADGAKELAFEDDNLIIKSAKQYLLSGLYTAGVVSQPIITLKVGIGGNIDPQGLYPKVEDPAQTDLISPILSVPTINAPDVANVKVTFLADVDQTQGNGQLLTEAGMFRTTGAMFNVKNHPGIAKTSDFSVHYEWSVRYL